MFFSSPECCGYVVQYWYTAQSAPYCTVYTLYRLRCDLSQFLLYDDCCQFLNCGTHMASKGRVDQNVSNLNVYQIACLEGSQRDITCPTIYSTYIADGEEYLCAVVNF